MGNERDGNCMPRLDNSIDIKAPADQVFEFVSDVTTHPEWVKWTKEAEVTSLEARGVGTTTAGVMQVGAKKEHIETLTTEYKDGQFVTRRNTRGMEMMDRLSVLPFGDGCILRPRPRIRRSAGATARLDPSNSVSSEITR